MTCKPGELVAIPFPYSDLTTRKRRPVLVMTHPDGPKIFTLSETIIVRSYGSIHPNVLNKVMKSICSFLGCD